MLVEVNGSLERAIKTLKNKVNKDGLMAELRRREGYLSRSEWRRQKDLIARRRKQKRARKAWASTEKKKRDQ